MMLQLAEPYIFIADISIVAAMLILGFFLWKDRPLRFNFLILGSLYGFFVFLWHYPIDWSGLY